MTPSVCFNFLTKAYGKCRVYRFQFDEMGRVLKHFSEICFLSSSSSLLVCSSSLLLIYLSPDNIASQKEIVFIIIHCIFFSRTQLITSCDQICSTKTGGIPVDIPQVIFDPIFKHYVFTDKKSLFEI